MTSSPLRTLFITQHYPYPPLGGAPLRNWQNICLMKRLGSVGVFCLPTVPQKLEDKITLPDITVWCIQPESQPQSWVKKLTPRSRQLWWLLTQRPPYIDKYYVQTVAQQLNQILTEFQPDLVIFEELWLYCYFFLVKQHGCRIILDAHNVETSLFRQIYQANRSKGVTATIDTRLRLALIESIERDFADRADQVWVCSREDASLLRDLTRKETLPIQVVPNGVEVASYNRVRTHCHPLPDELEPSPQTLIFTASFSYAPNALAAQFLLEDIYPRLRQAYPSCRLLLVGKNPTPSMLEAAQIDRSIIVTGIVPDIRPYLAAASVVIVPLLQGGGTRLKILEAFAAGLPVVSTSKGAEGLNVWNGEHLLIGETGEELANRVSQIWENPDLAQTLTGSAFKFVQTEYSWEAVGQTLDRAVNELLISSSLSQGETFSIAV